MKNIVRFFCLSVSGSLFFFALIYSDVRFGGGSSQLNISAGASLNITGPSLYVQEGTIKSNSSGIIQGERIKFQEGYFNVGLSQTFLTGVFDPSFVGETLPDTVQKGRLEFTPDPTDVRPAFLLANSGGLYTPVLVKENPPAPVSPLAFLRGQPLFFGTKDIVLEGPGSFISVAVQNELKTSIELNGGYLLLQDNLSLGDNATLKGDGSVRLFGRNISLGGVASTWPNNIIWDTGDSSYTSFGGVFLNGPVKLDGLWYFYAHGSIGGNGNVLDLSGGGQILVLPQSSLSLSNVVLKGLGKGGIMMAPDAQLILSDVTIEMNDNFDIYSGGLYINGPTTFILNDNMLTFRSSTSADPIIQLDDAGAPVFVYGLDAHGSLTVDRVALTYDPLEFLDKYNIRPLAIQDPSHKYINVINKGSIRKLMMESISFLDYSSDTALQRYAVVMPTRPIKLYPQLINDEYNYDFTVNGSSNFYRFSEAYQPLMFISDGVHAIYENMLFSQFSAEYLSLGANSSLIFGDNTTLELFRNEELNYTWTFQGDTVIRGGGSVLTLGPKGAIVLQGRDSTLTIQDINVSGLSGNKIRCLDDSNKIIFKDVTWRQDATFTFSVGALKLLGDMIITGPQTFNFSSTQQLSILSDATLLLTRGATLQFSPLASGDGRNRLQLADSSAILSMENSILAAPAPGLYVARGYVNLMGLNKIVNNGGINSSTGIVFDKSVIVNDSTGYGLTVTSGVFIG